MNKVILMGRLTRDVEMRQTPNGVSVARFTIAVDRRFRSRDGQQQTDFITCVAWRQTAEFIGRFFGKGRMIAVVGSIQSRSWDGQDGAKHYATEVVVDEAYFTGSKAESGGSQGGYSGGFGNNGGYGGSMGGGYGSNGGYSNNSYGAAPQTSAPAPAPQADDAFGGFDDGGFMDIDGSEDDLPF